MVSRKTALLLGLGALALAIGIGSRNNGFNVLPSSTTQMVPQTQQNIPADTSAQRTLLSQIDRAIADITNPPVRAQSRGFSAPAPILSDAQILGQRRTIARFGDGFSRTGQPIVLGASVFGGASQLTSFERQSQTSGISSVLSQLQALRVSVADSV